MKKTILFILDDFHLGGLATFVHTYTQYLNSKGYTTIVMGEIGNSLKDNRYYSGSSVIALPLSPWTERHNNLFSYLAYRVHFLIKFVRAYRVLSKHTKVDAVHFNLTWGPLAILLCCPSVYRIARVITFYGDFALEHKSRVGDVSGVDRTKRDIKVAGLTIVQWVTLFLSSKIVVFSQYSKDHLVRRFGIRPSKMTIIPGVIHSADYPLRSKKRRPGRVLELVNISRFENRKGHNLLLDAVSILLHKGYDIHLTIRGPISGEILPVLKLYEELRLARHVTILYSATIAERRRLLQNSDLFIMPSRELETFGLAMVEALASGTPVVGTPVGAIPEVLSLIDTHLIAQSPGAEDIARAIEWYIKLHPKKKNQLAKQCREIALARFDQLVVLPKLEQLYSLSDIKADDYV